MRKYMDEALSLIKNMQKNQESSIFKSTVERFRESTKEQISPTKMAISALGESIQDKE